ncbi:MAG: DUF5715 family protein [Rubricoccaceae bacterium]
MSRSPALLLALLATAALAAALGWVARGALPSAPPGPDPPAHAPDVSASALDSLEARLDRLRGRLVRVEPPAPEDEAALRRPRTPPYTLHLARADSLGVPPVRDEADVEAHVQAGRLVPLGDTERYVVRVLEHSKPFATPRTRAMLDEIGRRFRDSLAARGLPPYRLVVTSGLRTADLQADLTRTNRNAIAGTSSHEYGTSIDLVYTRYAFLHDPADVPPGGDAVQRLYLRSVADMGAAHWQHLYGVLARVLRQMQREGRVLVLLEAEQPVFHLTLDYGS